MNADAPVFQGVRLGNAHGRLSLTVQDVEFQYYSSTEERIWRLDAITEHVVKPTMCSADLRLKSGTDEFKESVSLRLASIADLARFRKVLVQKIKEQRCITYKRKEKAEDIPALMPFPEVYIKQHGAITRSTRKRETLESSRQEVQCVGRVDEKPASGSHMNRDSLIAEWPTLVLPKTEPVQGMLSSHSLSMSEDSNDGSSIAEDELAALLSQPGSKVQLKKAKEKHIEHYNTDDATEATYLEESETSLHASFAGSLCMEPSELSFLKPSQPSLQPEHDSSQSSINILRISQPRQHRERRKGLSIRNSRVPSEQHHFPKQSSLSALDEMPIPGLPKERRQLRKMVPQKCTASSHNHLPLRAVLSSTPSLPPSPHLSPNNLHPNGRVSAGTKSVSQTPLRSTHASTTASAKLDHSSPIASTISSIKQSPLDAPASTSQQSQRLPPLPGKSPVRSKAAKRSEVPSLIPPLTEQQLSALQLRRRLTIHASQLSRKRSEASLSTSSHNQHLNDLEAQQTNTNFHSLPLEGLGQQCKARRPTDSDGAAMRPSACSGEEEEEIVFVAPMRLQEDDEIVVAPLRCTHSPCRTTVKGCRSKKASFAGDLTLEPSDLSFRGSSQTLSELSKDTLQCLVSQQDQPMALSLASGKDIKLDPGESCVQSRTGSLKLEDLNPSDLFDDAKPHKDSSGCERNESIAGSFHASFAGDLIVEPAVILRKSPQQDLVFQRPSLDLKTICSDSPRIRQSRERRELQKLASMMGARPNVPFILSQAQVRDLNKVQSLRSLRPPLSEPNCGRLGSSTSCLPPRAANGLHSLSEPGVARLSRERQQLRKELSQMSSATGATTDDGSSVSEEVSVALVPAHRRPSNPKNKLDFRATRPGAERVSWALSQASLLRNDGSQQLTAASMNGRPCLQSRISSLSSSNSISQSKQQLLDDMASVRNSQAARAGSKKGDRVTSESDCCSDESKDEEISEPDIEAIYNAMGLTEDDAMAKLQFPSSTTCFDEQLTKGTHYDDILKNGDSLKIPIGEAPDCEDKSIFYKCHLVEATVVDEIADVERPSAVASAVEIDKEEIHRKRISFWVGVACCIMVVLSIVTSLTLVLKSPNESGYEVPASITPEEHLRIFREQVRGFVYNESSLDDKSSAQYRALHWLLKDPVYLDINDFEEEDTEKFEQRFYLAVFFFSMTLGSSSWEYCKPPETGENSACVHPVLESYAIEGEYYNQYMRNPAFRWLSDDECRWAGVVCADGVHVSHLHLAGYKLTGTIPVEIGQLSHLQSLDLQQNNLKGPLPPEWGTIQVGLPVLESVRLDQNQFTGPIPDQWCNLSATHLQGLILAKNELTGTLPSCLSRLTALEDISVMHNSMTGTVPVEFGQLLNLETLHLAGNSFSGTLPESICALRYDHNLFEASCDCLDIASTSVIECPCCTKCCDGGDTCNLPP